MRCSAGITGMLRAYKDMISPWQKYSFSAHNHWHCCNMERH
jgi:hypothetical protein